jgi:hypothetical protein
MHGSRVGWPISLHLRRGDRVCPGPAEVHEQRRVPPGDLLRADPVRPGWQRRKPVRPALRRVADASGVIRFSRSHIRGGQCVSILRRQPRRDARHEPHLPEWVGSVAARAATDASDLPARAASPPDQSVRLAASAHPGHGSAPRSPTERARRLTAARAPPSIASHFTAALPAEANERRTHHDRRRRHDCRSPQVSRH